MGEVNVEQHIIADKTLIRTAQVTSWILNRILFHHTDAYHHHFPVS